jgi:hypothetical protein
MLHHTFNKSQQLMHRRASYAFAMVKNSCFAKELADKTVHKFRIVPKEIAVPHECLEEAICGQMIVVFEVVYLRYQHQNLEVGGVRFYFFAVFVGN